MRFIFKVIVSFIYKILDFFNLVPAFFVLLIGAVLYFTGTLSSNPTITLIFQILIILSIVYAIIATVKKLLGIDNKKVKKSKGMQIVSKQPQTQVDDALVERIATNRQEQIIKEEKPRYFKLKQNPDYIMAEYSDRYELLLITANGLKKVRTDYKG